MSNSSHINFIFLWFGKILFGAPPLKKNLEGTLHFIFIIIEHDHLSLDIKLPIQK